MRLLAVCSALLSFAVALPGYPSQEDNPDYLLQGISAMKAAAEGKRLNSDDAQAYGYTAGLIIGISDSLNTFDIICTPDQQTILDKASSVEAYLTGAGYEELVEMFAGLPSGPEPVDESVMVMFALRDAYPCDT